MINQAGNYTNSLWRGETSEADNFDVGYRVSISEHRASIRASKTIKGIDRSKVLKYSFYVGDARIEARVKKVEDRVSSFY